MFLRDHSALNTLRRLWGWTRGRHRLVIEGRDDTGHFVCGFECRGTGQTEAAAHLKAYLTETDITLVEINEVLPATVPFPRDQKVIQVSERIYFWQDGPGREAAP